MLVITLIVVVSYSILVWNFLRAIPARAAISIPVVHGSILSMMGVGQGAYLAKKDYGHRTDRKGGSRTLDADVPNRPLPESAIAIRRDKMKNVCDWFLISIMLATSAAHAVAQGKKGAGAAAAPASSAAQSATPSPSSSAAIESQMLAYGALGHIASSIAGTVCSNISAGSGTVVIYDQASFASLQSYEAFIANAEAIVSLYETLLPDDNDKGNPGNTDHNDKKTLNAMLVALAAAEHPGKFLPRAIGLSSTIDPFSDATALLSAIAVSSNSETPGSIVIPDSAMAVGVTRGLKANSACTSKNLTVIYPPLFGNSSSTDFASADIQSDLQRVQDVRDFVTKAASAQNTQWMAGHATSPSGNPVLTASLTDVNGIYDSFLNSLLQANSTSGTVGSASVIQGYQLANVLAGPAEKNGSFKHPAFILLASILSAGGTELDHKTFWTALGPGDKITYSGGVIVNVALWHSDDTAPIYSNLLRYRVPFSDVGKPANTDDVTVGDNLP
jgi:hypothetical protein